MKQLILFISTILIILSSCDFGSQIKETVGNSVKNSKVEMESEISLSKSEFGKLYEEVCKHSHDSTFVNKAGNLYFSIIKTSKYIDSLRIEMSKLDEMDTKNVELVKQMYIHNGIGDSIFNKVKLSYSLVIDMTSVDTDKLRLEKTRETFSEETKKQFFELNNPLGVNMILYGIESELIKDGTSSIVEHKVK